MRMRRGSCNLLSNSVFSGFLFRAAVAGSEDLEGVAKRDESELLAYPARHSLQFGREKLDRVAARCADHMVMRAPIQAALISDHSIPKIDLIGQAALCKQLQSSVDGCIADARIALSYSPMKLLDTEVLASRQEYLENAVSLSTLL